MVISRLLDLDRNEFKKHSLTNVLGDSYLMRHNPVFRLVRKASLRRGFRYVRAWPEYHSFGLLQLDRILTSKKIPTKWNRPLLESLNESTKKRCALADVPSEFDNYQMHEAAHGIAECFFKDLSCKTTKTKILKAMMCESFANASEALSTAYAENETHRIFLGINCYIKDPKGIQVVKRRCIQNLGTKNTFVILYFSYLFANFLYETVPISTIPRLLSKFGDPQNLTKSELNDAYRIFKTGLLLNLRFRTRTLRFYLMTQGVSVGENILKNVDIDFIKILGRNPKWNKIVHDMAKFYSDV